MHRARVGALIAYLTVIGFNSTNILETLSTIKEELHLHPESRYVCRLNEARCAGIEIFIILPDK